MNKVGKNAKPVVINRIVYLSMFKASVDSGISFPTIWKKLKEKNGAFVIVKKKTGELFELCSYEWLKKQQDKE